MDRLVMLLRELPRASRGATAAVAACVVALPALRTIQALMTGLLFAAIPGAVEDGFDSDAGRSLVLRLALFGTAYVLGQLAAGLDDPLRGILARRVDERARERVLRAVAAAPGIAHLEDPALLDLVERARKAGPGGESPGGAADGLAQLTVRYLTVATGTVIVASFRWWLPILLVPVLLLAGRTMRRHINVTVETTMTMTRDLRRARYLSDLAMTPAAAKELRLFGLGSWLRDRFLTTHRAAIEPVWRARAASRRRLVLPELARGVVAFVAYGVLVDAAVHGEISVGRFGFLFSAIQMVWGLSSMTNADVAYSFGIRALPAIPELEAALEQTRLPGTRAAGVMPVEAVRFEGVSFRYPGSENAILDGLDLELRAGESLAVVGSNGAGKTTLVKLLARFYDPTAGRVTVDGVDLRELDASSWQCRVAAIFQDFTHYELSVAENVGLGAPALLDDRDALREAARRAGALELIEALPDGWDTVLSRRVAGGVELSGGEWQRIALARALLAVDAGAGILVLDEPTANLDARAETQLYDRFLELTAGVTTVVISHRFSTVRRADRIVVLRHGRVVESGSHDELLALGGRYARMFQLQAARFDREVSSA
ncbi:MAG TPA: ABC transporter ATP-binding protein [Acidimicrobiales bacterium]|nr:ABC transporter ATP-binding protein [Acidimicrobiales bacterium]